MSKVGDVLKPEQVAKIREQADGWKDAVAVVYEDVYEAMLHAIFALLDTVDALREQLREAEDVADKAALDGYENGLAFAEAEAESKIDRLTAERDKAISEQGDIWEKGQREIRRLTDALREAHDLGKALAGAPAMVFVLQEALAEGEGDTFGSEAELRALAEIEGESDE